MMAPTNISLLEIGSQIAFIAQCVYLDAKERGGIEQAQAEADLEACGLIEVLVEIKHCIRMVDAYFYPFYQAHKELSIAKGNKMSESQIMKMFREEYGFEECELSRATLYRRIEELKVRCRFTQNKQKV